MGGFIVGLKGVTFATQLHFDNSIHQSVKCIHIVAVNSMVKYESALLTPFIHYHKKTLKSLVREERTKLGCGVGGRKQYKLKVIVKS